MSDLESLRAKLAAFDADAEPDAFWDLLTEEAASRVSAAFAFVLLQDEEEEYVVYPGLGLEPDDIDDLAESPTFGAAVEAVGLDGPAAGHVGGPGGDPIFFAAVPIKVDGEVAGALGVERYEKGEFGLEELSALAVLTELFAPHLRSFFE